MKSCSNGGCGQDNPQSLDNFYKNSATKDGLVSMCKVCVKEKQHEYRKRPEAKLKAKLRKQGPAYKRYEKDIGTDLRRGLLTRTVNY